MYIDMYSDKQFLSYDYIPQYTGANSVQKNVIPFFTLWPS